MSDRLYALYVVAIDSGMRQGELFALAWDEVDWSAGTLQVRHSLEEIKGQLRLKEVKTKKGRRRIYINDGIWASLSDSWTGKITLPARLLPDPARAGARASGTGRNQTLPGNIVSS